MGYSRLRMSIYGMLVNRVPVIREKYHTVRDTQTSPWQRLIAWCYLVILNCAWILGWRGKADKKSWKKWQKKLIAQTRSESALSFREKPEELAERLSSYDVISFDVFDTLLFRTFANPTDLFYAVGQKLDCLDFKRLRMEAEENARRDCMKEKGHREANLSDIYDRLWKDAGIPKEEGMRAEVEAEERFCFANPYMLEVFRLLHRSGKRLVLLSDMYLSGETILRILKKCGYPEPEACFVSCDYGLSKSGGTLYKEAEKRFGPLRYIHVGDNRISDGENAKKAGWDSIYYANVNAVGNPFRSREMSSVTGSVYRGLVNAHLHNGLQERDPDYEYGFLCGGILALGYCQFIHSYVQEHGMEKILFLARDGDILCRVYRLLYPQEEARIHYVLWSRLAAVKMTARYYKYDYFRRFLYHKVNQGFTLEQIFEAMEIADLLDDLPIWKRQGKRRKLGGTDEIERGALLQKEDQLTDRNIEDVKAYLDEKWEDVLSHYETQLEIGKQYYAKILDGCRKAVAVDVGWAGSGAMALDILCSRIWELDCEITGLLAGTNTCHNAEPDMSEAQLASGKLVSYLFSAAHNRDLWKIHDAAMGDNVALERLFSSPYPSFRGFVGPDWEKKCLCPGTDKEARQAGQIQQGILDFVRLYLQSGADTCICAISGRDAAAPAYLWMEAHREETMKTDIQCVLA